MVATGSSGASCRIPNPTVQELRAYAHGLGKELAWTIRDPVPTT